MDSSQKRERDRKQRMRRQEKEVRRKERAEQKLQRLANPDAPPLPYGDSEAQEHVRDQPSEGEPPPGDGGESASGGPT